MSAVQSCRDGAPPERSVSAFSHRRARSAIGSKALQGGRPLVRGPQVSEHKQDFSAADIDAIGSQKSVAVAYAERGDRWMEKQEAKSLRIALEDMDFLEERRVHNAAQDEATELVKQHQNPETQADMFTPYDYKAHLRKGSYASPTSVKRVESIAGGTKVESIRWASSESCSKHSEDTVSQNSDRTLQCSRPTLQNVHGAMQDNGSVSQGDHNVSRPVSSELQANPVLLPSAQNAITPSSENRISSSGMAFVKVNEERDSTHKIKSINFSILGSKPVGRRRSSGPRLLSVGLNPGPFKNPDDKIYEEPDLSSAAASTFPIEDTEPKALVIKSRNASGGKRSIDGTDISKRFSSNELHKQPPSRSRDPSYTQSTPVNSATITFYEDPEVPKKNGLEIRSEEIRAATSLKLKSRSPKLPTPSMVSNRPGRPIVSFDPSYKTKQERLEEHENAISRLSLAETLPTEISNLSMPTSTTSMPIIPTIKVPEPSGIEPATTPKIEIRSSPGCETKNTPGVSLNNSVSKPSTSVHDSSVIPSINISEPSQLSVSTFAIPTIVAPESDYSNHPLPSPSPSLTKRESVQGEPLRPRPFPYRSSITPLPLPRSHWTPISPRVTAQCSACALPIAGRIVSAASQRFHPACFSCFACGELLECVAFYPEPDTFRSARLTRIGARLSSLPLLETEIHVLEQEDGDDSLRFYCHLDFHEKFSPRCRSCKTPIEGEVVVACGGEWHVGHFFCADCGDPFDSNTPFVEKDGYAWCVGCHSKRFNGKCAGCRKVIEEMVVKALGREWHEACFCCMVCSTASRLLVHPSTDSKRLILANLGLQACGGGFEDGRFFTRGDRDEPVCVRCEELRLKA